MEGGSMSKLVRPIDGLSEEAGRAILRAAFQQAGYEIVEDYKFDEDGVSVVLDGYDPKRQVGYEYLTREAGDKDDFSGKEIGKLLKENERGKVHLLLIDGEGRPDKEMLEYLAKNFLKKLVEDDETVT
jgi:hypothetical protein